MPLYGLKCLFKFSKWVLSMRRRRLNLQPVSFAIYTWLVGLSHNLPPYFECVCCAKSRIISKLLSRLEDLHRVFALIPKVKKRKKSRNPRSLFFRLQSSSWPYNRKTGRNQAKWNLRIFGWQLPCITDQFVSKSLTQHKYFQSMPMGFYVFYVQKSTTWSLYYPFWHTIY